MIAWSKYYHFSAEEVEYIQTLDNPSNSYPYQLTVHFKSGKSCSVSYSDSNSRDAAINELVRNIDREKRADSEKILNLLYQFRYSIERVDKRQLRIWRQLRDLLGLKIEED